MEELAVGSDLSLSKFIKEHDLKGFVMKHAATAINPAVTGKEQELLCTIGMDDATLSTLMDGKMTSNDSYKVVRNGLFFLVNGRPYSGARGNYA